MAELCLLRLRVGAGGLLSPRGPYRHDRQRGHPHVQVEGVRRAHSRPDGRDLGHLFSLPIQVCSKVKNNAPIDTDC